MSSDSFKDFICDQLSGIKAFRCQWMFGGYGLYSGDLFFGILYKEKLFFKTDAGTKLKYLDAGMKPFKPSAKQTLKNYYEVPVDWMENGALLAKYAEEAVSLSRSK